LQQELHGLAMNHDIDRPGGPNLAERIRRLANGRNTIDVAQFQFIGLTEIKARYGRRWPEKRERVQGIAGEFISKRIAPEDVLIPGADGFLVVFGSRAGVLADTAAVRISKELNTFFMGCDGEDADMQLQSRHASMSVDDFAQAFGDLIAESNDEPGAPEVPQDPGHISFAFAPVWDTRRGALTTFFVTPRDAAGRSVDASADTPARHAELDEMKLKASEEAIRALFASGRKALVGVALHVSSLNNQQSLARLFSVMANFDKQLVRYRVIRVTGVEPGFPRIYLEDILRTLKSRIPTLAIGLNWTEPDVGSVLRMQPAAVGFTLPPGALSAHAPRADLFARVHAALEISKPQGVPFYIEGDIAPDQAQRFANEGVQLIASPQIWPVRNELTAAEIWPASRLSASVPTAA
jgi:hypothetical protein